MRYSNVSEVPLALAVFLASDNYDYNDDPQTISATTLLKPLRQIVLAPRVPETIGVHSLPDMIKNRMGAAIHDAIERSWKENHVNAMKALGYPQRVINQVRVNPTPEQVAQGEAPIPVYLEQRLHRKMGDFTISGKFDFIGDGRVQDFKSTTVWTYLKQVNNEKYAWQGSIYRWLDPKKITQDKMDIHFIFTDHAKAKSFADPTYPPRAFKSQTFDLKSLSETEAFIRGKVQQIQAYRDAPEDELPPCTDADLWRSDPVFKYYKNPANATKPGARSSKNFSVDEFGSASGARQAATIRLIEDGNVGVIVEKPGEVTACKYCPAFAVCSQKDELIASGDLVMDK